VLCRQFLESEHGALTFCVVDGGSTGVEIAGALSELLHVELAKDYPNLPVDKAKVLLYEQWPHLLAPFAPKLRVYAQKALEERGVEVHTGTGVAKIGAGQHRSFD
jgi:NADH dehydrogenase